MVFGHQKIESRRLLLREIAQHGPVPRIDLAEHTGISRATVTSVTADLLRGGLIEEVPRESRSDESARGRPRVDLRIAGEAHLIAGLKVSDRSISLVLMRFDGTHLADHECPIPAGRLAPKALATHIRDGLAALADKAGHDRRDISGVGVGLAGVVDADHGLVYWSPSLDQRNVPFGDVLRDTLGVAVYLDNDANLVAMAELTFGLGKSHSDFIVITIESGVGMGMVLGGQLYRGTRGCGAEFGHTKVHLDGALCRCGQRGCPRSLRGGLRACARGVERGRHEPDSTDQQSRHHGIESRQRRRCHRTNGRGKGRQDVCHGPGEPRQHL